MARRSEELDGRAPEAPARRLAAGPLTRLRGEEQPFDYILLPYTPVAPTGAKLASESLLRECLALMGVEEPGMALVETLKRDLGPNRTVWGIKYRGPDAPASCELYFYRRDNPGVELSLATVRRIVAPHLELNAELDRTVPWLMFSFELTADQLRAGRVPKATLYVQGENLMYDLEGRELTLTNLYRFYSRENETSQMLRRLSESVHVSEPSQLGVLIPPALARCGHVCVANKRHHDAMYFSRAPWAGFRRFLDDFAWPDPIRDFVDTHRSDLDYLLWDVGFDFRLVDGQIELGKSSFYGYF